MKQVDYFNTTKLQGEQLSIAVDNNRSQNEIIKSVFQAFPSQAFTAYDIIEYLTQKGIFYKETSVRRAMTQLKNRGLLVETTVIKEKYSGHPNKALRWK